jgi:Omp85 superfamily domain/WD40-like Beta Propeller Repeat
LAIPRRFLIVAITLAVWIASEGLGDPREARAAGDPYLQWWTVETPHFRVHYYKGLEPIAERVATIAEGANQRLSAALGWNMSEVTEIVLTDNTDDANGSATAIPYNAIHLFVTAPDDLSPLGDYDDWYLELVTHEHTHILHTDNIGGLPALLNKVFGKWLVPNQVQPRWILEGLAVYEESRFTGGGRNRSSLFDMYLRADTLEHRLAPLDQVSHFARRWPQGNLWYLYGSHFVGFISDVYGGDVWKHVAEDYGKQLIPWGINRSIRRATGRTYEELYEAWSSHLEARYGEQVRDIEKQGLREGVRLTRHGQVVASPRWVPAAAGAAPGRGDEILFFRDDAHSTSGLYRFPFRGLRPVADEDEELMVRTAGHAGVAFEPEGGLVFNSTAVTSRVYAFNDLFRLPPGAASPSGFDPERQRLTQGQRAQDPDISPDGTRIVFTENHRGTTTLIVARRAGDGTIHDARALVPSARFEQAFTPRFSPDGRTVAYSAWTAGGYRDIRLVDVATGQFTEVAHDRAMDWGPAFSPDGKLVFFASDRAGEVPNVFAFERATGKLWQVTNVRTGALSPDVSPDGKTLVYVGYTSYGYDLYAMALDRSQWTLAPAYVDTRPDPPAHEDGVITDRHPYNPLPTLRPRSFTFDYGPGSFGNAFTIAATGGDAVGLHGVGASILVETERSDPQGSISYAYGRLPFDFGMSIYRTLTPNRYDNSQPLFIQQNVGISTGVGYTLPSEFEVQSFALNYSIARFDGTLTPRRDPLAPIVYDPPRGQLGTVYFGWAYSNAEAYLHTVGGAERGFSLSAYVDLAFPALASDYTLYVFGYSASKYIPMPWARHHTLALHAAGGMATGSYPSRGYFYVGGFVDVPLVTAYTRGVFQGGFVLRGYPPLSFGGEEYQLYNTEYRFPILTIDHGLSTLPIFVGRISGNLFADYGGAFNDLDADKWRDQLHLGVGAELWLELTVAYHVGANIRFGYARGVADDAAVPGGQTYVVIAAPY